MYSAWSDQDDTNPMRPARTTLSITLKAISAIVAIGSLTCIAFPPWNMVTMYKNHDGQKSSIDCRFLGWHSWNYYRPLEQTGWWDGWMCGGPILAGTGLNRSVLLCQIGIAIGSISFYIHLRRKDRSKLWRSNNTDVTSINSIGTTDAGTPIAEAENQS